jgi:hypothetical protein
LGLALTLLRANRFPNEALPMIEDVENPVREGGLAAEPEAAAKPARKSASKATTGKRSPWTKAKREKFLAALADTANVAAAARAVKLSHQSAYALRRKQPAFAKAWDAALDLALDELEATLLERAIHGVDRTVFYGGKPCGTVRQYSDALAMFLLKARRPRVYGAASEADAAPEAGPGASPGSDAAADSPRAFIEGRLAELGAARAAMEQDAPFVASSTAP